MNGEENISVSCPNGHGVPPGQPFCGQCGAQVNGVDTKSATGPDPAPRTQTAGPGVAGPNDREMVAAAETRYGPPLSTSPSAPVTRPQKDPFASDRWVPIAVVAALVVLLVVVGVLTTTRTTPEEEEIAEADRLFKAGCQVHPDAITEVQDEWSQGVRARYYSYMTPQGARTAVVMMPGGDSDLDAPQVWNC